MNNFIRIVCVFFPWKRSWVRNYLSSSSLLAFFSITKRLTIYADWTFAPKVPYQEGRLIKSCVLNSRYYPRERRGKKVPQPTSRQASLAIKHKPQKVVEIIPFIQKRVVLRSNRIPRFGLGILKSRRKLQGRNPKEFSPFNHFIRSIIIQ